MSNNSPLLSVVIASYNSAHALEKNLPVLCNYLANTSYSHEILVVDDGSTDNGLTRTICEKNSCTYLKLDTNQGKGAAIKHGMLSANGKYRIFTDADIPYEPEVIEKFIYYLDFKEFDMVVGDRSIAGGNNYYSKVTKSRSLASKVFSFIVGRFIAGGIFDTQCGIKGFKANIAQSIFESSRINGFAFDVELFHIALLKNYDIKRVPVVLRSQDGKSVNLLKNSIGMLFDLIKIISHKY
ncbi:MAG: glycosyltransferase [Bacteroidia bacterium]|nr:glycosyltransferase [Bacteroidia bacterium]